MHVIFVTYYLARKVRINQIKVIFVVEMPCSDMSKVWVYSLSAVHVNM